MTKTVDRETTLTAKGRHRSWRYWLGLLISLGCLSWALWALDWAAVAQALTGVHYVWIAASVLTVLLSIATRLARWAVLLYPHQARSNNLLAAMLIGQVLNYFAPARAGDLARAYFLGRAEDQSTVWVLSTVALEKLWDIWMLLAWVGLLSFSTNLPDWLVTSVHGLGLLSFLVLALFFLAILNRQRVIAWTMWLEHYLPPRFGLRLHDTVERLLDGLQGLRQPRVWFWSMVWAAATWGLGTLTNWTIFMAIGLSLPLSAALMLMAVLQMGIAVPSLPGRIGVFEGLCIVVLALFDVNRDAAFAVGLVLHAVVFVPPTLMGLYYAWRSKFFQSFHEETRIFRQSA